MALALPAAGWAAEVSVDRSTASPITCEWKTINGVKVPVPPTRRPRLYLRADAKTDLDARLWEPALQPAAARLTALAAKSPQYGVEWDAVRYVANPDEKWGRSVIERTLTLMKETQLQQGRTPWRETGRMMVTGAIVYDWLYPLLTPDEMKEFIAEFVRLAKTLKFGYPPARHSSVTSNSSEDLLMRNLLSAGIAIYDEFPEMYDIAAERFFGEYVPARNWMYQAHAHPQGDYCGPMRYSWETFPLFIFDRLGAGNVFDPEQRLVPYYFLYSTRPDGQRLRSGDSYAPQITPRGVPWGESFGTLLTANYYGDEVLLGQAEKVGRVEDTEALFEFLWRDPNLRPSPGDDLPLSYYAPPPMGWMIARTGWDKDAVIAEMKVNEFNTVNHQHLDAGAFQIYYKGPLAVDSGVFFGSSGEYGSPHNLNYSWRTIAHNSLLVYDPNEKFQRRGSVNDGGQRMPNNRSEARTIDELLSKDFRTGKVLAQGFGPDTKSPDFTLLSGDITRAYSKKVKQVLRTCVFLNLRDAKTPAAMVVFDRVVAADPAFRKYWLLHSMERPRIEGSSAVIDRTEHGESGRLILDTLLPRPENLKLEAIGGSGKEFWVFGKNYPNDLDEYPNNSIEAGAWRIEASPLAPAAEDLFLNVMQVTDTSVNQRLPVRLLETATHIGCVIEGPEASWAVVFRRDGRASNEPVRIEIPSTRRCRAVVCNLTPGNWAALLPKSKSVTEVMIDKKLQAACLEAPGGRWEIERIAGR
jgi:heparin/heparan-sulfate lyase